MRVAAAVIACLARMRMNTEHLRECVSCGYGGHNQKSATEVRWRDGEELHLCDDCAYVFDTEIDPNDDPTPWCHACHALTPAQCECGPLADNR